MRKGYRDRGKGYLVQEEAKQQTNKVGVTPVVGLDIVTEAPVEIFIIKDGECNLTSCAGGNDDGHQRVADPGEPPDETEHQGGDDEELHVNGHVPGNIDTVGLAGAVDVLGIVVDVEEIKPPPPLTFVHTGVDKMCLRSS